MSDVFAAPRSAKSGSSNNWFGLSIEPAPKYANTLNWTWLRQFRYALVDGQRLDELPAGLATSALCPGAFAPSAHLMPRLADLSSLPDAHGAWLVGALDRCTAQQESPPFVAFLQCACEPDRMAQHLAAIQVHRYGDEAAWLRVHDPMVFLQLGRVLDPQDMRSLFGPVQRWSLCVTGEWIDTQPAMAKTAQPPKRRSPTQLWHGLLRIGSVNRTLMRRAWLTLLKILLHSEHVDHLVQRAERLHDLQRPADQAAFADLGAELALDFDQHPLLRSAIQSWKADLQTDGEPDNTASLIDELEQLPATIWDQVRIDCALSPSTENP